MVAVLQKEKAPISLEALAEKAGASEQVEAIYKILRHIHANQRGVVLQGDLHKPGSLTVSAS